MENFGKMAVFSGRILPDWGNTAWVDMAGLGSKGLTHYFSTYKGVKILKYDKIQTFQIDYLSPFLTSGGTIVKISTV